MSFGSLVAWSEELPAELAEPLHLGPPWWSEALLWLVILGMLVLIVLITKLSEWWSRRARPPVSAAPAPPAPDEAETVPTPPTGIVARIEDIRRRHVASTEYRRGCHRLSLVLREHLEEAPAPAGERYTTLTAGEIRQRLGEAPWSRFFADLAQLQFGRRPPSGRDWREICDRSLSLVAEEERR